MADGSGEAKPPQISGSDIADMALLLASLIPAVRAGRIAVAAVRGLGAVGRRVLDRVEKITQKPDISKRPNNVPKHWEKMPADKKEGTKYVDPKNPHNDLRIQKGNPNSQYPNQRGDYVRWKKMANGLIRMVNHQLIQKKLIFQLRNLILI